jgi:hypothetical protein
MESVNKIGDIHDPLQRGNRALDEKTRELVDSLGRTGEYDLVLRDQEYPYTGENTRERHMPENVDEEGVYRKGVIPLAGIDLGNESIDVFYDSISRFEIEKRDKARKFGRSVRKVNDEYGTDWSTVLYLQPEKSVHNEPEVKTGPGIAYTAETKDALRDSEPFADLSSGLFAGWLEISSGRLLEPDNLK